MGSLSVRSYFAVLGDKISQHQSGTSVIGLSTGKRGTRSTRQPGEKVLLAGQDGQAAGNVTPLMRTSALARATSYLGERRGGCWRRSDGRVVAGIQ
jgi:hypothetical protein